MRSRCNGAVQHSFALFVPPADGRSLLREALTVGMEAVYDTLYVLALVQPLLADIVWRQVRSMAVVVNTLDVGVCACSSAYGVCAAAAAGMCSVLLRKALMAGREAVYGLTVNALQLVIVLARVRGARWALRKEENRAVRTAEEWLGHEHIVCMADEMFAIPGLVRVVHVSMLSVV